MSKNNLVQSIMRAIDIIELLSEQNKPLGVTKISEKLDMHKSTVHRIINTLKYRGYVIKNSLDKYQLGYKILGLSSDILDDIDVREKVRPYLKELVKLTNETVHLGVLDRNKMIYIDKEETTKTIRMHSKIGGRIPLHCTSLGKVFLAFKDKNLVKQIPNKDLIQYTSNTITEKAILKKNIDRVKKNGYAIDNEEHEEGISCIAGPIFNHNEEIIAAFSISGPTNRMTNKEIKKLIPVIKKYSKRISKSFGYNV